MSDKLAQVGRVAFRVEGANWNAYWALPDSMRDAVFIASTRFAVVEGNPARKSQFMAFVREAISDMFVAQYGARPTWPEPEGRSAPDHERTKE
jgi:hypothetical protein